jgi:hypothetical protein
MLTEFLHWKWKCERSYFNNNKEEVLLAQLLSALKMKKKYFVSLPPSQQCNFIIIMHFCGRLG